LALPAELNPDKTERLRLPPPEAAKEPAAVVATSTPLEGPGRDGERGLLHRLSRRVAHRVLGPSVTARLRQRIVLPRQMAGEALRRSESSLRRIEQLEQQMAALQRRSLDVELVSVEAHAATINLELLKGEIHAVEQALEDLGMAIAPATGLAGAGVRLSELRERVNGLDRRLRAMVAATSAPTSAPPTAPGSGAPSATALPPAGEHGAITAPAPESALFDYVGFERRFRGDPEVITAELSKRYLEVLAANPPVIDVGCGRGELVELLAKRGVEVIGVDTDPSMVAEARERGLDVRLIDGASFLRGLEPGSVGAIIATHVVEHIELSDLVELLELAAARLRLGGVFIAETPNPASLIVLGNSYILDPTHVRPIHPSLLAFLCEGAGFRDIRLQFYAPATGYHLPLVDDPAAPAWTEQVNEAFTKLNSVLFGPQEYAVIASAAPALAADHGREHGDGAAGSAGQ
jgi:SAM-dependent methyltransferase